MGNIVGADASAARNTVQAGRRWRRPLHVEDKKEEPEGSSFMH